MVSYLTQTAQLTSELDRWIEILLEENVRRYLEIGSLYGASLWYVASALPRGSTVVSVDLCEKVEPFESLTSCIRALRQQPYKANLVRGDSTSKETIESVIGLGPFDAVFIDGNHAMPYIQKDFTNYGMLARIVGFHDIMWDRPPEWAGTRIDVPIWWRENRARYRSEEIVRSKKMNSNGIGVIWR